jgi:hypothetical protein
MLFNKGGDYSPPLIAFGVVSLSANGDLLNAGWGEHPIALLDRPA